ncbi:MAG TPA: UDP-N-acetylmuramoyl-tripeptide--D-alanyl-D-alanine ligase [Chthoniobacteraceae bacterium]|nr:UDP-N-acetylmuramoyl-tripeptide--D-alanyl-D-alanine ligase [Chthoniobacteraceae bacterium]
MDPVSISAIASWVGGGLERGNSAAKATRVSTDSRALAPGSLFVALRGEKFDGHSFIRQAAQSGAVGAMVEEAPEDLPADFAVIRVKDSLAALQSLAAAYRRTLRARVVNITGSNGKTSTKDFTAAVLGRGGRVAKTEGNLNNHIGLPLTILRASSADDYGVFEIGMNHPGEIAPLAAISDPDAAIITNIGVAHIEFMGSQEAIAREKGMLAEAVGAEGFVVLPSNDPFTDSLAARTRARVIRAGIDHGDVFATGVTPEGEGSRFTVHARGESIEGRLAVPGPHMVRNAMLAVAAGLEFGVPLAECVAGLAGAKLTKGRLERKSVRGIHVLDDSYNANPDSMVAALETLAQMPGRRIAVLGQMNELGAESERGHRRVGEAAARGNIDSVITVGPIAAGIAAAAREHGVKHTLTPDTTAEAAAILRSMARNGDTVLIKGSRSVKMETIVEELARP